MSGTTYVLLSCFGPTHLTLTHLNNTVRRKKVTENRTLLVGRGYTGCGSHIVGGLGRLWMRPRSTGGYLSRSNSGRYYTYKGSSLNGVTRSKVSAFLGLVNMIDSPLYKGYTIFTTYKFIQDKISEREFTISQLTYSETEFTKSSILWMLHQ